MDAFEKEQAKKELEVLKSINRNINFLGRKLEMTNNILGKYGIAILPGAEESSEKEETPALESMPMVKISDIKAWSSDYYAESTDNYAATTFLCNGINRMLDDLEKRGKIIQ